VFGAFRSCDVTGGGSVPTASLSGVMAELGADWDADELAENVTTTSGGPKSRDFFLCRGFPSAKERLRDNNTKAIARYC
jgi:hypothetical protein